MVKTSARSQGEFTLARQIEYEGLPTPERQFFFARPRRFRSDFAWPDRMLLVEVDGATFMLRRSRAQHGRLVPVGRHNRREDLRRGNLAARLGFMLLRYTPDMVQRGEAIRDLKEILLWPDGTARPARIEGDVP
jgi:very-short-patch-repair endonuclease